MRAVEGNVETLLRENAQLRQENAELAHARSELSKRVEILAEQIAWFKNRFFARSSEALSEKDKRQLRLFDEGESSQQMDQGEDPQALVRIPEHTRGKAKRRPLPEALPREEVVIDIPEEQKHCLCGAEFGAHRGGDQRETGRHSSSASRDSHHPSQVRLP